MSHSLPPQQFHLQNLSRPPAQSSCSTLTFRVRRRVESFQQGQPLSITMHLAKHDTKQFLCYFMKFNCVWPKIEARETADWSGVSCKSQLAIFVPWSAAKVDFASNGAGWLFFFWTRGHMQIPIFSIAWKRTIHPTTHCVCFKNEKVKHLDDPIMLVKCWWIAIRVWWTYPAMDLTHGL